MELFEKLPTLFASLAFLGLFREVMQILLSVFGSNLELQYRKRRNNPENSSRSPQFAGGIAASCLSVCYGYSSRTAIPFATKLGKIDPSGIAHDIGQKKFAKVTLIICLAHFCSFWGFLARKKRTSATFWLKFGMVTRNHLENRMARKCSEKPASFASPTFALFWKAFGP